MPNPGSTKIVGALGGAETRVVAVETRNGRIWPTTAADGGGEEAETVVVEVFFSFEGGAARRRSVDARRCIF